MKKIFSLIVCLMLSTSVFAVTPWEPAEPAGSRNASDIDLYVGNNNTALDRLNANYRRGATISYASAGTFTVGIGELTVSNSGGTDREFLQNTTATTVTWSDIDTGAEDTSTTYYVYAVGDSSADTFTIKISESSTEPTGSTQFLRLGSFYNNASDNITLINNDNNKNEYGDYTSKSVNVTYQALTDGVVVALVYGNDDGAGRQYLTGYTDSSSAPSTLVSGATLEYTPDFASTQYHSLTMPVQAGNYYKVVSSGTGLSTTMNFVPKQ